jgi:hypothetical protein
VNEPESRANASGEGDYRDGVRRVAAALRDLHKTLIDVAKGDYEQRNGPVGGPSQLLNLVMFDPAFGWMHVLSELMVDIDELLDVESLSARDAAAVRFEVERLISPAEGESVPFTRHYVEALQSDPDLVIEHAKVRRALTPLPQSEDAPDRPHRAVRAEWSQRRTDARQRRLQNSRDKRIH